MSFWKTLRENRRSRTIALILAALLLSILVAVLAWLFTRPAEPGGEPALAPVSSESSLETPGSSESAPSSLAESPLPASSAPASSQDSSAAQSSEPASPQPPESSSRPGSSGSSASSKPEPVAVKRVALNKSSLSLQVGGSAALKATITPSNAADKNVTWASSNTGVATVSGGTVTAKAAGTATVTVKTANGKTASCAVTVTKPYDPLQAYTQPFDVEAIKKDMAAYAKQKAPGSTYRPDMPGGTTLPDDDAFINSSSYKTPEAFRNKCRNIIDRTLSQYLEDYETDNFNSMLFNMKIEYWSNKKDIFIKFGYGQMREVVPNNEG